jgi:hypothetical protein
VRTSPKTFSRDLASANPNGEKGVEKMATIEEVVKVWDETHPNNQTGTLTGKNVQPDGKIGFGAMHGRLDKWAVIKLADGYPFSKWDDRICYVFDFKSGKPPEINFQRRNGHPCDAEKLYDLLDKNFNGKEINGEKLTLARGRINPNHLVLKRVFPIDSSAKDICDGMKELINLTQKPICKFLEGKDKEEAPAESEEKSFAESEEHPVKNEDKIFLKIMSKHGIRKNGNKELYGNCLEIYSQTIDILNILRIGSDDSDDLKVSYYTKKIIAQSLLIEPKCEKKCEDFRFYNTHKMNDPSEGKTLLSFLGINKEDSKLPKTLPFIGCFTLEVDNLNQFRLYGNDGNREATGVSLVFRFDFFNEDRELCRCVYIDLEKDRIKVAFSEDEEDEEKAKEEDLEEIKNKQQDVKKLLNCLKKSIKKLFDRDIENTDINRAELAKDLLIRIRYIVKDYAFKEERECRIINLIDKENKEERSKIKIDGERFYINICEVKDYIREIYFAPLAEGMEVFEIETGKTCIRSRHPFNSQQDNKLHCRDDVCTFAVKFSPLSAP